MMSVSSILSDRSLGRPPYHGSQSWLGKTKFFFTLAVSLLLAILVMRDAYAGLQDGLVGYWPFDEGAGTTVTDFSGNGNTGTLRKQTAWWPGVSDQALFFDGADDYVEIPDSNSLDTPSTLTVSAWINNQTLTNRLLDQYRVIASKGSATSVSGSWTLAWSAKDGSLVFFVGRGSTTNSYRYAKFSFGDSEGNRWHLITAVVANGKISLYQDGVLKAGPVDLDSSRMRASTEPLRIAALGSSPTGSFLNWDGLIDEVRVYNRALQATEIVSLYQKQAEAVVAPTPFSFSVSKSGSLAATQGFAASNTITAALLSGNAQAVSLSVTGLPQGATASFSQITCIPNCYSLFTVRTSSSTPTGTYALAVKGTAAGMTQSTNMSLSVSAAPTSTITPETTTSPTSGNPTSSPTATPTTSSTSCNYFASPTGTGNGLSATAPFKISKFWSVAGPGKILCLLDGVYTGAESMIDPPDSLSGTAGRPITIRAVNEGKATINGQGLRRPVLLNLNNYFVLEGFNAHSSVEGVIRVVRSSHNVVRRVAAWDAFDGNHAVVSAGNSVYVLFEDVAAWGVGRKIFSASQGGNHVTCRRCWGRWEGSHDVGPKLTYSLAYNNYDMLIENSIGTWSGERMKENYVLQCAPGTSYSKCGQPMTGYTVDQAEGIFGIDRMDGDKSARSKILGSIAYITKKDRYQPGKLYWVAGMNAIEYGNNAAYVEPGSFTGKRAFSLDSNSGGGQSLIARNLTAISSTDSSFNRVWQISNVSEASTVAAAGNIFTATHGAQICKRYKDGELTSEPLWPWPMNQRISEAMVASGRAAVDVTNTIESIFGPIPSQCRR